MSDRPPLDLYVYEQIDAELHALDKIYWPRISEMRVPNYHPLDVPVPPKRPEHLRYQIEWYAEAVYKAEADKYVQLRNDRRHTTWLALLENRVLLRVMTALDRLEEGDPGSLILGYHGLDRRAVEHHLNSVLWGMRERYVQQESSSQPEVAAPLVGAMTAAYDKAGVDMPSGAPPLPIADQVASQLGRTAPAGRQRMSASVNSQGAALKMEAYMNAKGLNQTEFAIQAGTTDKTIRKFRQTGRIKLSILRDIAKAMGTTREELLG